MCRPCTVSGGVEILERLNFSPLKKTLMKPLEKDGHEWSEEQADLGILWYRRYLILVLENPHASLVPSKFLDEVWHTHILDTAFYTQMCAEVFGEYVHHDPYFGEDEVELDDAFTKTLAIFQERFGSTPVTHDEFNAASKCSKRDCIHSGSSGRGKATIGERNRLLAY